MLKINKTYIMLNKQNQCIGKKDKLSKRPQKEKKYRIIQVKNVGKHAKL